MMSSAIQASILQPNWPAPPNVHAFTTLRYGLGVSPAPFDQFNLGNRYSADGDKPEHVEANRALLKARFPLPNEPRWLRQVHGVQVLRFDDVIEEIEPTADASVTSASSQVLAILTADCLPVLFTSRAGDEVAAAHAGWRGLAAGVLEQTIQSMRTAAGDVIVCLGPGAGPQAYEVGEEVRSAFAAQSPSAIECFRETRPQHYLVDLYELARQRLHAVGVNAIYGGDQCTISEPEKFFSHRRDQRTGRMASIIWFE
jgi:polyphenol oxidase